MRRRRPPRTRQQLYPDTDTFTFHNVNPQNRITGDCVFRAFTLALEQDYAQTVREMADMMIETGYALNYKDGEEEYLRRKGWTKQRQPRKADRTKYTVSEFAKIAPSDRVILHAGGHHTTCIIEGKIHDIWNCGDKSVGNYWIKAE